MVRSQVRAWLTVIERTTQDLQAGILAISHDSTVPSIHPLEAATSALYTIVRRGFPFAFLSRISTSSTDSMYHVTSELRQHVIDRQSETPRLPMSQIERVMGEAREARAQINEYFLNGSASILGVDRDDIRPSEISG